MNQQRFKEDSFNDPPMAEGEIKQSLQLGHWLEDFHQICTPPILLLHPLLVCMKGFGMKTLELLSSSLLPCLWHTDEVSSPS